MIRIYLSPRYNVDPNRTRNILAQFIHYPDSFDEMVNVSRGFGICVAHTDQSTHDAILADGRVVPLSPLYIDASALSAGLLTTFDNLDAELKANAKTALEAVGINTAWISGSNNVKDVLRLALRSVAVIQILTGEHRADVLTFLKGNIDSTVGQVPLAIRNAVRDWMMTKGLATGWIVGTTTVRQVIHFIVGNLGFGVFKFSGEGF